MVISEPGQVSNNTIILRRISNIALFFLGIIIYY